MKTNSIATLVTVLAGRAIPGGCDDCDAVQYVRRDTEMPNLIRLSVEHDDDCPTYRRLRAQGLAR